MRESKAKLIRRHCGHTVSTAIIDGTTSRSSRSSKATRAEDLALSTITAVVVAAAPSCRCCCSGYSGGTTAASRPVSDVDASTLATMAAAAGAFAAPCSLLDTSQWRQGARVSRSYKAGNLSCRRSILSVIATRPPPWPQRRDHDFGLLGSDGPASGEGIMFQHCIPLAPFEESRQLSNICHGNDTRPSSGEAASRRQVDSSRPLLCLILAPVDVAVHGAPCFLHKLQRRNGQDGERGGGNLVCGLG